MSQEFQEGRRPGESQTDYVKRRTIELYDLLPTDEQERKASKDIRDKIVELNYTFFGYVASHTFINNPSVTYEDKFQSAVCAFLDEWWKFRFTPKYRADLSFAVFFKPRIGEKIERELNEVKYSIRRSLCMEAGAQLGKHWGKVRYEDLSEVNLPADKLNSLKAMFGTLYSADIEDHMMYMEAEPHHISTVDKYESDEYNDIEGLLIREMIDRESALTDKDLYLMSDIYDIPYFELSKRYQTALEILYEELHNATDM